ncbi:MAG: ArnT family glycosyltransferase [Magnetovibrionaceae bacterium]
MARPLLPVNETRFLAVAWEMWLSGDWLVPHLNGQVYDQKPPLLFWLVNIVWSFAGVEESAARLVAPSFGLATVFLSYLAARMFWPEDRFTRYFAPLVLSGTASWVLFSTLTDFEMMIGFFATLGIIGLLLVWRGRALSGWGLVGLCLGLGALAKGPFILIHLLPAALLAPLWMGVKGPDGGWGRWYLGLLGGLGFATVIVLAWALPAAQAGGDGYSSGLLWSQTAGILALNFDHVQPWWFFAAVVLPVVLPWSFWPSFWRAAFKTRLEVRDPCARLLLVWFLGVLILLSVPAAKQVHFLLPALPAFALLVARMVARAPERGGRFDALPFGLFLSLLGIGVMALPFLKPHLNLDPELAELNELWGIGLVVLGLILLLWRPWSGGWRLALQSAAVLVALVIVHVMAAPYLVTFHNVKPTAQWISLAQQRGLPIANISLYHGQYHFLGRLKRPIDSVWEHDIGKWLADHNRGKIISYHDGPILKPEPEFLQPFRSRMITIRDYDDVKANPRVIVR